MNIVYETVHVLITMMSMMTDVLHHFLLPSHHQAIAIDRFMNKCRYSRVDTEDAGIQFIQRLNKLTISCYTGDTLLILCKPLSLTDLDTNLSAGRITDLVSFQPTTSLHV